MFNSMVRIKTEHVISTTVTRFCAVTYIQDCMLTNHTTVGFTLPANYNSNKHLVQLTLKSQEAL